MEERINIFNELASVFSEGQKVVLRHASVPGVLLDDPLVGFVTTESYKPDKMLWIVFPDTALAEYMGEERVSALKNIIQSQKELLLFENGYFLYNVLLEGIIGKIEILTASGLKIEKGMIATTIKKDSDGGNDCNKGFMYLEGEGKSIVILKDRLKERLAEALEPYTDSPVFSLLTEVVFSEIPKCETEREFRLFECEQCGKAFLIHVIELINQKDEKILCRECGKWRYESLTNVPFGTPLLLDAYYTLDEYFHKDSSITFEKIGKIITSAHPTESGVVWVALRDKLDQILQPGKAELINKVESIVDEAQFNNPIEFRRLIENLEQMSSIESLQTTKDISRIILQIQGMFGDDAFEFMFPHPKSKNYDGVDKQKILQERFSDLLNLYKDIYDLFSDHLFMANIGRIIKGESFDDSCIPRELFGKKLVDKSLEFIKDTRLEDLVMDIYDNKIRNAIGHPGRYIDPITYDVSFFNKGKLILKLSHVECLDLIKKTIDFHMALVDAKYKLAFEADRHFLSTGGILSLQPEIFDEEESGKPVAAIVINQLWCFEKYSPSLKWWADNFKVLIEKIDGINRFGFLIERGNSKFDDPSLHNRRSDYDNTAYIKEWIDIAVHTEKIDIIHRKCFLPIDISLGEKFPWLQCKIFVDYLQDEILYFVKFMEKSGTLKVTGDFRKQLIEFKEEAMCKKNWI